MKLKTAFVAFLSLALFVSVHAWELDKAKLDQFFDLLAEKNQAMGSLAIVKDGKVLYSRATGYSQINGTEKIPLTSASRFRIASIGKTHIAVMIMQLADEKTLKLTIALPDSSQRFQTPTKSRSCKCSRVAAASPVRSCPLRTTWPDSSRRSLTASWCRKKASTR